MHMINFAKRTESPALPSAGKNLSLIRIELKSFKPQRIIYE